MNGFVSVSWSVAGIFVSKKCPRTHIHNLLTVFLSRSGASALRCTICCRFVSNWYPGTRMYGFLSVSWSIAGVLASKWVPKHDLSERCPSIQMYDLFVGVFVSKWCPLRCVAGVLEVVLRTKMYGLLSMSWFRSGADNIKAFVFLSRCLSYSSLRKSD